MEAADWYLAVVLIYVLYKAGWRVVGIIAVASCTLGCILTLKGWLMIPCFFVAWAATKVGK